MEENGYATGEIYFHNSKVPGEYGTTFISYVSLQTATADCPRRKFRQETVFTSTAKDNRPTILPERSNIHTFSYATYFSYAT